MLATKQIQKKRQQLQEADHRMAIVFKAMGDISRLRIFRMLTDEPKISVSTIAKILHLSVPLASQHIKILAQAQLLQKDRIGKKIFSRLDRRNPIVRELIKAIRVNIKSKF